MQTTLSTAGARVWLAQSAVRQTPGGAVSVRYLESPSIIARGPATGRKYTFSGADPVQQVDARDAGAFLHARFFRRA